MVRDTMEPTAIIRKQLEEAEPDLLRGLLHDVVGRIMAADVDGLTGAAHGARTPERTNQRNGYRGRRFDTRLGTLDLRIPKLRSGSYFPDWLLEPGRRSERALTQVVAEAYVLGVSTRRVDELVQALGITGMSKSQVSELAKSLDEGVTAFRSRPLDGAPYRFLQVDALAIKVREAGRIVQAAALLATGVNRDGRREILGLDVVTAEDGASWLAFFRDLVARGLTGERLPGAESRWSQGKDLPWTEVRPELVCEVRFDKLEGDRFRHGTRFLRFRPDKGPRQCTWDQVRGGAEAGDPTLVALLGR